MSAAKARVYTSRRLFPSATPHGLACFTITQAVSSNSFKQERAADITLTDVSDYTQFPEIMDGRVKTINPLIEGGLLGLRDQHATDANANNIKWIVQPVSWSPFFNTSS